MDEFKPEDELKPDPSDRRAGRSRQSSDRENEPQINFDDVDFDADDRRPTRARRAREEEEEYYESDDEYEEQDAPLERRPRHRKKAAASKPASRQYIMMGLGILVLLLLIIGIGSALKAPSSPSSNEQTASTERNIDLSGSNASNTTDQANGAQPAPGDAAGGQTSGNTPQDVSVPPIASTPTQGQVNTAPEGQQRVEVQGDLNNALTQQQGQIDNAATASTLPTEPATVAPVRNGTAGTTGTAPRQTAATEPAPRQTTTPARPERKQAVIEAKPQTKPQATAKTTTSEPKPVAQPKPTSTPAKTPAVMAQEKPAAPAVSAPAASAGGKTAGDVGSLKAAPSSHYTLQLSSSSNYNNLNGWAKKENLKNYVVYETTRNGQPWYVLVSGVYASKDDAKRAVATLPADVQAKNPWAKPLHQVQADLK
ncbi:cell division protein DamX [Trabulsiella odontotermitis]|uniref:Cell division protein DamX n=1 Tax=Trabulsiella odontotermitis TaxID=379893 RepID=A0A0L0GN74_9ENTR|nr:cell division protein DamX [Trabulsiella odontotermitis]KNC90201.1 cell division protein DamX [Trabulsiella odontotermitis]